MATAFVDTTVLTDILIKFGAKHEQARAALSRYEITQLPVYAIKEFKAGPLSYYKWMHNKFAVTGSFADTMSALQAMSRTPKRYLLSTAIESLKTSAHSIGQLTNAQLVQKHGPNAKLDKTMCDEYRLAIKTAIFLAWKKRREITTEVVLPLTCYSESSPYEKRGLIELDDVRCQVNPECCLAPRLRARPDDLRALKDATIKGGNRSELQRRAKALRELYRKPKSLFDDRNCRNLGDAIFAFFAPQTAVILTTNAGDHAPLALALGKSVAKP